MYKHILLVLFLWRTLTNITDFRFESSHDINIKLTSFNCEVLLQIELLIKRYCFIFHHVQGNLKSKLSK